MTLRTIGSTTPAPTVGSPAEGFWAEADEPDSPHHISGWADTLPAPTEPVTHVHTSARAAVLRFIVVVALVSAAAIATAALAPLGQWPALCASPTR